MIPPTPRIVRQLISVLVRVLPARSEKIRTSADNFSKGLFMKTPRPIMTGFCCRIFLSLTAMCSFTVSCRAADELERALLREAAGWITTLQSHDVGNVGMLKFRVRHGDAPNPVRHSSCCGSAGWELVDGNRFVTAENRREFRWKLPRLWRCCEG